MSELYVIEGIDQEDADGRHWSRPVPRKATFAEKVAALRDHERVEERWVCTENVDLPGAYQCSYTSQHTRGDCGWRLVVPLDSEVEG